MTKRLRFSCKVEECCAPGERSHGPRVRHRLQRRHGRAHLRRWGGLRSYGGGGSNGDGAWRGLSTIVESKDPRPNSFNERMAPQPWINLRFTDSSNHWTPIPPFNKQPPPLLWALCAGCDRRVIVWDLANGNKQAGSDFAVFAVADS